LISIDTNILLRLIMQDDPGQLAAARKLREQGVFVSHGVLMEAEWVLRSYYRQDRAAVNAALRDFLSVPGVASDQAALLFWALDRHAEGADWADMLHIIASQGREAFATFDTMIGRAAGDAPPVPVRTVR
jgi:predicted nucleic-acid-binding protein